MKITRIKEKNRLHTFKDSTQVREEVPWRLACQGFDLLQPASAPFVCTADEL